MGLNNSTKMGWLQFRQMMNAYMLYICMGIGIAEILAFFLLKNGGMSFKHLLGYIPQSTVAAWQWLFVTVGPMLFALLPLAGICIYAVWKLVAELRMSDEQILAKTREHFGDYFLQLFHGHLKGISSFEAEKRLCQMFARFTNNRKEIIERLFHKSGLRKPHWEIAMVKVPDGPTMIYKDFVLRLSLVQKPSANRWFYMLEIVQELAVTAGFAGTVLALMATMGNMTANLSQAEMINVLLHKSSAAFGSTVAGIFISAAAYLAIRIFNRLFPTEVERAPEIEEQLLLDALVGGHLQVQVPAAVTKGGQL